MKGQCIISQILFHAKAQRTQREARSGNGASMTDFIYGTRLETRAIKDMRHQGITGKG
jgi:hypothetical protein